MPAVAKMLQAGHHRIHVVEQVAEHDDDAAFFEPLGQLVEERPGGRLPPRFGPVHDVQQLLEVRRAAAGADQGPHLAIESDQPHAVLLVQDQVGQRGRRQAWRIPASTWGPAGCGSPCSGWCPGAGCRPGSSLPRTASGSTCRCGPAPSSPDSGDRRRARIRGVRRTRSRNRGRGCDVRPRHSPRRSAGPATGALPAGPELPDRDTAGRFSRGLSFSFSRPSANIPPLPLGERQGVRANAGNSRGNRPHPNPLPEGEGIFLKTLGMAWPSSSGRTASIRRSDDVVGLDAFRLGVEVRQDAVPQHGMGHGANVLAAGVAAALQHGPRLRAQHQVLARPGTGAPLHVGADELRGGGVGRAGSGEPAPGRSGSRGRPPARGGRSAAGPGSAAPRAIGVTCAATSAVVCRTIWNSSSSLG